MCAVSAIALERPDHMVDLVPYEHVTYNDFCGNTIGAFCYSESQGRFYVSAYGSYSGIRCFVPGGDSEPNYATPYGVKNVLRNGYGISWQSATVSNLFRIAGSPDMAGGVCGSVESSSTINGIVLNPSAIRVNGTNYGAGTLAILSDSSKTVDASWQKRLLSWDLREVGSPVAGYDPNSFDPNQYEPLSPKYDPDNLPDRANAAYDHNWLEVEHFGPQYGYGCVNWNDAFSSLVTVQDLGTALGFYDLPVITEDRCADGNVCFSTDGKKVYFRSKDTNEGGILYHDNQGKVKLKVGKTFTGIWSYELETGVLRRLFDDTASGDYLTVNSELTVIPVGLRNLTGLPYADDVDQLLFDGSEVSGNVFGINCLILDGSDNPPIYEVLDGQRILDLAGIDPYDPEYYGIYSDDPTTYPEPVNGVPYDPCNPSPEMFIRPEFFPKVWSLTHDKWGNIYFYYRHPHNVYLYDVAGRIICLKNRAQSVVFNLVANNSEHIYYCENLRLSVRYIAGPGGQEMPQLMYTSTGSKSVAGINVYEPCDFDRDGEITVADIEFFKAQLQKTRSQLLVSINDA
ncbi:MAG: hypothetical protein JXM68_04710, partial [Sedimentisphaerales bacterium]|nr:hypothetical protein [Sedimentisphaerales bacterium]